MSDRGAGAMTSSARRAGVVALQRPCDSARSDGVLASAERQCSSQPEALHRPSAPWAAGVLRSMVRRRQKCSCAESASIDSTPSRIHRPGSSCAHLLRDALPCQLAHGALGVRDGLPRLGVPCQTHAPRGEARCEEAGPSSAALGGRCRSLRIQARPVGPRTAARLRTPGSLRLRATPAHAAAT